MTAMSGQRRFPPFSAHEQVKAINSSRLTYDCLFSQVPNLEDKVFSAR